jgi:two-component sensor histidine kinase
LVLDWKETGGPPVPTSISPGYGTSVIKELLPYELGGVVNLVFAPEGVRCRLEIPRKWLNDADQSQLRKDGADDIARRTV